MTDDLVERAQRPASMMLPSDRAMLLPELTAALIEARAEIARLREALEKIVSHKPTDPPRNVDDANGHCAWRSYHEARAALAPRDAKQRDA